MQVKTKMRYHFSFVRMTCYQDLSPLLPKKKKRNDRYQWRFGEKGTLAHMAGENINWFSLYGKGYRDSSQN